MDRICEFLERERVRVPGFDYKRNTIYVRFCHEDYSKGTALCELGRLSASTARRSSRPAITSTICRCSTAATRAGLPARPTPSRRCKAAVRAAQGYVAARECSEGVLEALHYFLMHGPLASSHSHSPHDPAAPARDGRPQRAAEGAQRAEAHARRAPGGRSRRAARHELHGGEGPLHRPAPARAARYLAASAEARPAADALSADRRAHELFPEASNALTIELLARGAEALRTRGAGEAACTSSKNRPSNTATLSGETVRERAESLARLRDGEGCMRLRKSAPAG